MTALRAAVTFALLASSCFSGGPPISGETRNVGAVTLTFRIDPAVVEVGQGTTFAINLQNNSGRPETLTFPSAQRYDFWVELDGREVWRWSDGQAFIQVVTEEVLEPQTGTSYTEVWVPDRAGEYVAHALLLADRYDRELSGEVTVR